MICYVLAMGKQHLGPHVVVGYGIKIFWPGLFITSPDHLAWVNAISAPRVLLHVNYTEMHNLTYTILILYCTEIATVHLSLAPGCLSTRLP